MILLCDVGQVEGCFGPFGDSVNLNARKVLGLHRMYQGHRNLFGCTGWSSKVTWVKWMLDSVYFEIVLISMQDRCMVCAERPIGLQIILGTSDRTRR